MFFVTHIFEKNFNKSLLNSWIFCIHGVSFYTSFISDLKNYFYLYFNIIYEINYILIDYVNNILALI